MNGQEIAALIQVLAPIATEVIIDGAKVVATIRADMSIAQLQQSLELSKSANWPKLTFGQE